MATPGKVGLTRGPNAFGLAPFYALCGLGLYGTGVCLIYILWAVSFPPTVSMPIAILVAVFVYWRHRRIDRALLDRLRAEEERPPHGRRLGQKLQRWQDTLQAYSGEEQAR